MKGLGTRPVTWFEDAETQRIIWAARDGNVQNLADRLRKGLASREEMAFAADLIEGKVKPIFGLKGKYGRHVYDVVKALDPESRKRHELYARYAVLISAGNPTELPHFMGEPKLHESDLLRASVLE